MIVRGEEALLPRGSTRIEAADRLHVMVREEVAERHGRPARALARRPGRAPDRAATRLCASGIGGVHHAAWTDDDGDAGFPKEVHGVPVAEQIRTRRDQRGALVRSWTAASPSPGRSLAIGGPLQLQRYARRRLASEEDAAARAWWQEVIGALAR